MQNFTTNFFKGFSDEVINLVWEKGQIDPRYDANYARKDACGAFMIKEDYGNTKSNFGWEIDHIKPVSDGGTDDLYNLRPLQWENNRAKSDGKLVCVRRS